MALAGGFGPRRSARIGHDGMAHVMSTAARERCVGKPLQEKLVISVVSRVGPREPRGVNARGAVQGVDHQPTIFAQDPAAEMPGLFARLEHGIGGECIARFFHFQGFRNFGDAAQREAPGSEQLRELKRLLPIARSQDQIRHGSRV